MSIGFSRPLAVLLLSGVLAGCVDHANAPILQPVGNPVNIPIVAHNICIADGNAMYDEAQSQYKIRAQMTGYAAADAFQADATARAAARRQYVACLSAQGYRAVYPQ